MTTAAPQPPAIFPARDPIRATEPINPHTYQQVRRSLMLNHCKWDSQVGDVCTLAPFALILSRTTWQALCRDTEDLACEALAAEGELLQRPILLRKLGLPSRIRRTVAGARWNSHQVASSAQLPRIVRFDFHWTTDGWQISEANADVPGGFSESSALAALMAPHVAGAQPLGNPAERWADAIERAAGGPAANVALLAAPGHLEDQQVISYLAQILSHHGLRPHLCGPNNLQLGSNTKATLRRNNRTIELDLLVRFFQAEWLASLPHRKGWPLLFAPMTATIVANPATTTLIESKRFPLVWNELHTPLTAWLRLLPPTFDPRQVDWCRDDRWILKAAFSNTGDSVVCPASADRAWKILSHNKVACRSARWRPGIWAAQQRFETRAIDTPAGRMFPCIGVYTVNGKVAGAYGRLSPAPLIDFTAIDVAVMVENNNGDSPNDSTA